MRPTAYYWFNRRWPGAGIYCRDIESGEELFLMDILMSGTLPNRPGLIATRTICVGEYHMTGGAGLGIGSERVFEEAQRYEKSGEAPCFAQAVIRACLAANAADHAVYSGRGAVPFAAVRREPRMPPSKRRRR